MKMRQAIKMARRGNVTHKARALLLRKETRKTYRKLGGEHGYADAAFGDTYKRGDIIGKKSRYGKV